MAIIPTITFDTGQGYDSTIAVDHILAMKKRESNITILKTSWVEYVVHLPLSEINDRCNYSNKYAEEWNSSGKEPTHLGNTPFPCGAWETL